LRWLGSLLLRLLIEVMSLLKVLRLLEIIMMLAKFAGLFEDRL
jgi:hypothetical protein